MDGERKETWKFVISVDIQLTDGGAARYVRYVFYHSAVYIPFCFAICCCLYTHTHTAPPCATTGFSSQERKIRGITHPSREMYAKDNHATSGSHFNLSVGTVFLSKYQVIQVAGTGNFAKVYECVNVHTKERVAVKVLKKGYERDADFECDVLKGIARCDPNDEEGVVKLVERTVYQNLAVIVFKLKGAPLRNARLPMSESDIKQVVQDVGDALSFLHFRVKAVHTDLKPENILAELHGSRKWALCDLGSASFYKDGQLDRDLITTRPYRAPEVVLNRGWCFPSDTWSLGCILYELRTGKKLFDCHTDADHLRMMEDRLGTIPSHLRGASRVAQNFASRPARTVADEFRHEPEFLSLLMSLLDYDPTKRIRCDAIRSHPYMAASSSRPSSVPSTPTSSAPSSARDSHVKLDMMMRGLSTNDENAHGKKPFPHPLAAPPQAPFTFGPSASANGATVRPPLNNYTTTSSAAYGSKGHLGPFTAPLAAMVAAKRRSADIYADDIPMSERPATRPYASNSAPASASNSPVRLGSHSAHNSPRLVSPAYVAPGAAPGASRPLSYRLTYL